jgi:hypothetical protein
MSAANRLQWHLLALWRNWQTQQTQNLPEFTLRLGSTPSSATILSSQIRIPAFSTAVLGVEKLAEPVIQAVSLEK